MLALPKDPSLADLQAYVRQLEEERGFTDQKAESKCLLLGEEVGELFKAVRKYHTKLRIDEKSDIGTVEEELADILIYLCAIANKFNIDLEKAFRDKEEINKTRTWK